MRGLSQCQVDVENIEEEDISSATGSLLTSISVFNSFGAALDDEEGSFVIPDGSGALINFNNGKTSAKAICQRFTDQIYQPFLKQSRP